MPVFMMNTPCTWTKRLGSDVYGAAKWDVAKTTKCAVIKLTRGRQKSTVRADSSGSRGHADEVIADAVLLFAKTSTIAINDKLTVHGINLHVLSVFPRFNVMGALDHYEVEATIE